MAKQDLIWTPEARAELERLYLVENMQPSEIAPRLGPQFTARGVIRKASRLGLAARRDPEAAHEARCRSTAKGRAILAARRRVLAQLRCVEGLSPEEVAARLDEGSTAADIRSEIQRLGLDGPHSKFRQRGPVRFSRPQQPMYSAAEDRALIDAAIAAGKVTVLPSGLAAGLSQMERQFYAAPPPPPEDPHAKARAARAGRNGAFGKAQAWSR